MGLIKFIKWLFSPSTYQVYLIDELTGEKQSLLDYITELEIRIQKLEYENIETTNTLYEIMNTLDKFNDSEYDLRKFTLGE